MLITWISVDDAMPTPYKNVLVSEGVAYWDEYDWYSMMDSDRRKIEWEVRHWASLPKAPVTCSGCVTLKEEISELKAQIAMVCGFGQ
ncbi:hypothetical protein LCGC14_3066700 [marine sediment metagenome]|uniref:DUF551 domain-containing protein n=1 Tax=marine sediment metagenome TaxID=412755 RepID=A0A0F8X5J8_9ZZZZ